MSDLIEKVARAIGNADHHPFGLNDDELDRIPKVYAPLARAAIAVVLTDQYKRAEMGGGAGHPSKGWLRTYASENGVSLDE